MDAIRRLVISVNMSDITMCDHKEFVTHSVKIAPYDRWNTNDKQSGQLSIDLVTFIGIDGTTMLRCEQPSLVTL